MTDDERLRAFIEEKRASVRALGGRLPPQTLPQHPPPKTPKIKSAKKARDTRRVDGSPKHPTPGYLSDLRRRLDATISRRQREYSHDFPHR